MRNRYISFTFSSPHPVIPAYMNFSLAIGLPHGIHTSTFLAYFIIVNSEMLHWFLDEYSC